MPGASTVKGAQPIEYQEETNFGSTASADLEGAYNWFGLVTSFSATQGIEAENVRYLPAAGSTNKLETVENVKVSEAYSGEITFSLQDLTPLQYWTGAAGDTSDDVTSIVVGEQNEDSGEFRNLTGGVGEEVTLTIEEDGVAEMSGSFIFADATDWGTTDYIGSTGSHAAADTTTPSTYGDLGGINLGGTALSDAVESLTLTVSNDLEVVKDPDATTASQIAAIVPTSREISVELALTYDDMSMAQTVRSYTKQDLTFNLDVGGVTNAFTVTDTQYPEFPYEFAPEDLVGDTVTSDPASGLTWA